MYRLVCALVGVCLLGNSAAFGQTAPPAAGLRQFTELAGTRLLAADGSTLTLRPADKGLMREIAVPDGRIKKTLFAPLTDQLGTVSESSSAGALNIAGIFRLTGTQIAATYADGRSEVLKLSGSGGVSMTMTLPTGQVSRTSWQPAGHRSNTAERKAALPSATAGPDIFGRMLARLLISYARQAPNPPAVPPLSPADTSGDGFEDFYVNFLAAHEGGYTENDGNGSPANFGINQGANPDIDVLNLTQAEAKQILHDRYWVAAGADRLPKSLVAVHGDTAINMGVGAANELLTQSGGDAQKYLSLRDARYRAIAAPDSGKAGYLPVWLGRNDDLRSYAGEDDFAGAQRTHAALPDLPDAADAYGQVR